MLYSRLHNLLGVEVVSPELSGRWKYVGNVHLGAGVLGELSGRLCGQACPLGAVGGQEDLCGEDAHRGNLLTLYALSLSTMMPSGETSRSFVAQAYSPKCGERLSEKGYEQPSKRGFRRCGDAKMGLKVPFRWSTRQHRRLFRPFSDSLSTVDFSHLRAKGVGYALVTSLR